MNAATKMDVLSPRTMSGLMVVNSVNVLILPATITNVLEAALPSRTCQATVQWFPTPLIIVAKKCSVSRTE
jgi:hypothetical protein